MQRARLAVEAAGDHPCEPLAARGEMLAQPRGLLEAERGDRVVVAREIGLRVADQVEVGHAVA